MKARWLGLILALCCAAVSASGAAPHSPHLNPALKSFSRVGGADASWFGLKLYNASLWADPSHFADLPNRADYALQLLYARDFSADRLSSTSIDEMRRLGFGDTTRWQKWRKMLDIALPSVKAGESIVGVHLQGRGAQFWHEGRLHATVDDAEFADAFFAIWLDPRTREPRLRAALLGGKAAQQP